MVTHYHGNVMVTMVIPMGTGKVFSNNCR